MNTPCYDESVIKTAKSLAPGIVLICSLGILAFLLHSLPIIGVFSSLILSIVLGMAWRNLIGLNAAFGAGVKFGLKTVLRVAVAFIGLQLSFAQIAEVGIRGFFTVAATLLATFLFTAFLGKLMGIDRKLTQLIGAGTSICGASAIIGVNAVTRGSDEDVAYSVGAVTLFGTISMFVYPLLARPLHLAPNAFGVWAGSSIHEVAQVVAASFQDGKVSGQIGTISKLSRVMLLAPVVVVLGVIDARRPESGKFDIRRVSIPWFVLGFVALVGLNSAFHIPAALKADVGVTDQLLLAASMAAMGLEADFKKLYKMGYKPLALGAAAWIFITFFSLVLVRTLY
jgi:uncharacterized integral membrane protein (TIGR00698 family)